MALDINLICETAVDGESLFGKKVFYSDTLVDLKLCVEGTIKQTPRDYVDEGADFFPFGVDTGKQDPEYFKYIYPAEKPTAYVAFSSAGELISTYEERVCANPNKRPPYTMPIIWVKYKNSDTVSMITGFAKTGVELGAEFQSWEHFFKTMLFLDGTPCGVRIN